MREDDETTAIQLQSRLAAYGAYVSLTTILHSRQMLGWVYRGATKACTFEGIMDAPLFCEILQKTLIPFLHKKFPYPQLTASCRTMILNIVLTLLNNFMTVLT